MSICYKEVIICICCMGLIMPNSYLISNAEAFPKKILDLMNVEGLTRENVASHLQAQIFPLSSSLSREKKLIWLCLYSEIFSS